MHKKKNNDADFFFAHTYVAETWCSFAFGSSEAAFVSSVTAYVIAKQNSNENGFRKCASFLLMHTVLDPKAK